MTTGIAVVESSASLYKRIVATHPSPEWACFPEVANGTGSNVRRHADALAMSLWPSRGLIVRGFEIKVSRHDYRREAADPMKAETIARYCDEWWIVAPDGLIREPETELPPAWGLMVPATKGSGLRVVKRAERTDAEPPTRSFIAAVLRAADKHVTSALKGWLRHEDIQAEVDAAEERGRKLGAGPELVRLRNERDGALKELRAFQEATGLSLIEDEWNKRGKELGEAARVGLAVLGKWRSGWPALLNCLNNAVRDLEQVKQDLSSVVPPETVP